MSQINKVFSCINDINDMDTSDYHLLSYLAGLENSVLDYHIRELVVTYPVLKSGRILDIGCYGKSAILGAGRNTSDILSKNYTGCLIDGINLNESDCILPKETSHNIIYADLFKFVPGYKYDYIVNDISFDQNRFILQSDYIMTDIPKILNKGGYYLHWVHRNDMSGVVSHSILDRQNFIMDFWGLDSPFLTLDVMREVVQQKFGSLYDVEFCFEECERDYINWFMLRLR